jgi:hypothetical protein
MGEETTFIRKAWWKNTEVWLYNLLFAAIGGASNSVAAMFIAPETFNIKDFKKLLQLFLAGALISTIFYLKQSPLPKLPEGLTDVKKIN